MINTPAIRTWKKSLIARPEVFELLIFPAKGGRWWANSGLPGAAGDCRDIRIVTLVFLPSRPFLTYKSFKLFGKN